MHPAENENEVLTYGRTDILENGGYNIIPRRVIKISSLVEVIKQPPFEEGVESVEIRSR